MRGDGLVVRFIRHVCLLGSRFANAGVMHCLYPDWAGVGATWSGGVKDRSTILSRASGDRVGSLGVLSGRSEKFLTCREMEGNAQQYRLCFLKVHVLFCLWREETASKSKVWCEAGMFFFRNGEFNRGVQLEVVFLTRIHDPVESWREEDGVKWTHVDDAREGGDDAVLWNLTE